jgi:hypothetical protein
LIPNGITIIGYNAFSGCRNLTSITIPNSVTSINDYAFYDCTSLSSVFYGGADNTAWSEITIGSSNLWLTLASVTRYYYREAEPAETGNFWHFVDGVPAVW